MTRYLAAAALALFISLAAKAEDEKPAAAAKEAAAAPAAKEAAAPAAEEKAAAEETAPPETEVAEAPEKEKAAVPFETNWKDSSIEEKVTFLEASPELVAKAQEKWDKSTPKQRKVAFESNRLLAGRSLKHKWDDAAPEEKIGFLSALPDVKKRLKETYELLTADQRLQLVRKRPMHSRKALHHAWSETTDEEKTAFIESQGDLKRALSSMWTLSSGSEHKALEEAQPAEKIRFVERLSFVEHAAADRWATLSPALRAQLVRRWKGFKLQPNLIGLSSAVSAKSTASAKGSSKKGKGRN